MIAFLLYIHAVFIFTTAHGWSWQCDDSNGYCTRVLAPQSTVTPTYSTLELCKLVCGETDELNVWPQPTGNIESEKNILLINPQTIKFDLQGTTTTTTYLDNVVEYFNDNLDADKSSTCQNAYDATIVLQALTDDVSLNLDTDEYYSLKTKISNDRLKVEIVGNTVFGVRHGVETLLQLLVHYEKDNEVCVATLKSVELDDRPVYRHRGLLLDSARNYLSVGTIKKNIDAMAASKMNVLHWHITDSQSFPLELPSLPNMTKYGAYDEKSTYSPTDMEDLVAYAKIRGVRILMEIDGPSHAGSGWQWGEEAGVGNLAVCINQQPWRSFCIQPPCGQLNPANSKLYQVLQKLYGDVTQMVPNNGVFHMGGDEVYIPCWNATEEIIDYIKEKPRTQETFLDLWGEFQNKSLAAYDAAVGHSKTKVVVWTSHLTETDVIKKYLSTDRYIIQTWVPDTEQDLIASLIDLGYKVIISTKDKWYLDHGFWGSTSYYNWRTVYNNKMYSRVDSSVLGGEVCMWGELVDDSNVESRVWPRAAAAAERLWSNPQTSAVVAEGRFFSHRERLVRRGLKTEAEMPRWCVQNEGECSTYL